jgi:Ca-activated chloride channel family protein
VIRRLALAAAGAALWISAPASAAVPVAGGGSFHDAPVLKPGSYRDTLLPQETLYYAVDLQAGQAIDVDAVIEHDDPNRLGHSYGVNVLDPMRASVDTQGQPQTGDDATSIHVTAERALTPPLELDDSSWYRQYRGPGRYYFTIVDVGAFRGGVVESDVRFDLKVLGDPSDLPQATATPTPTPTATPRAKEDDGDDGGSFATALLAGGGGLVAGALIGFAAVLATRRRRDH